MRTTATRTVHLCILLSLLLSADVSRSADSSAPDGPALPEPHGSAPLSIYARFNDLNTRIRDGLTDKKSARRELPAALEVIRSDYYRRGGIDVPSGQWTFPVAGHDSRSINKRGNHGFVRSGYDYFSGNRHGGHPAYDIFIRDRDQDNRDDRSGKPVSIVSMTSGVVVATDIGWQKGSPLRGGNYIWVYDPGNDLLVYYAHNDQLFVKPGDIVKPGDLLATMGRSGYNAVKRRSPTHLHLSVLRIRGDRPEPVPVFRELQRAGKAPRPP